MLSRLLSAVAVILMGAGLSIAADAEKGKAVDVAICIDTSNSMDGLIDSAKIKLWTIVNDLAKIQPTPVLRVSLYQYGNDDLSPKTGWVKKELDLTTDLDEVYKKLNALKTHGGTEHVARVCRDALHELKWTDEKDGLRLIFVCGNEPADQDKEVKLDAVAELAKQKGVFINTIYCGPANHVETAGWRNFSTISGGKYANIDQDRTAKTVVVKTPHDDALLKLNEKLNGTYICYGKDGLEKAENQRAQDQNALKAPGAGAPAAALERASTKASKLYRNGTWDIVDRMKEDPKFDIKKIKEEDLGEELKKLKPEEREAFVKKKAEERETLQKEIQELAAKRSAFIQEEMKKQPKSPTDKTFDEAVKGMIREQATTKGLKIPE